jgi:hypothetical protein
MAPATPLASLEDAAHAIFALIAQGSLPPRLHAALSDLTSAGRFIPFPRAADRLAGTCGGISGGISGGTCGGGGGASPGLAAGAAVWLHSLQARPELNGAAGTVSALLGGERCAVLLDDGRGPFNLKMSNLKLIPQGQPPFEPRLFLFFSSLLLFSVEIPSVSPLHD